MKSYDEIAESIMKKYNSRREQKRRNLIHRHAVPIV